MVNRKGGVGLTTCTEDYIFIPDASASGSDTAAAKYDRYCGNLLTPNAPKSLTGGEVKSK